MGVVESREISGGWGSGKWWESKNNKKNRQHEDNRVFVSQFRYNMWLVKLRSAPLVRGLVQALSL